MCKTEYRQKCSLKLLFKLIVVVFTVVIAPGPAFSQKSTDEQARKYLVRGTAAIEMAKSEEDLGIAAEEFRKATEVAPNMAAAWYNLGKVQSRMGQFKEAIDSFNRYLALAPQAEDAMKVSDEVTKLEFKLEQTEKFNSLSGQWITDNGNIAIVTASGGKLVVDSDMRFSGEYDYHMIDPIAGDHRDASPLYSPNRVELLQKGSQFIGVFENSAYRPGQICTVPPQKSEITGSINKESIVLKLQRMKFKIVEKYDGLLSVEALCVDVQPMGTMNVEIVLKPLPPGGILRNSAGLGERDEIISVDGTELSQLNPVDHIRKLRGQPGTTARLVVKRVTEEAGFFSQAKYTLVNVTAPFIEINPSVKGWLGIEMQPLTPELAEASGIGGAKGVLVKDVVKNGPGEKSGMKRGDVILEFDGKPIHDITSMILYVNATPVGKKVELKFIRSGKPLETTATIERREAGVEINQRQRLLSFYSW